MKLRLVSFAVLFFFLSICVSAIAAEIAPKWSVSLPSGALSTAQQGSTIYVALSNGSVAAYGIKDGKALWTAKVPQAARVSAGGDSVYVLAGKNLETLAASTGKSAGRTALPLTETTDVQISPESVFDCLLVQSGNEGLVYNVKSRKIVAKVKGRVLANITGTRTVDPFWRFAFDESARAVVVADAGAQEVRMIAIDTGKTLWAAKAAGVEGYPTLAGGWAIAQATGTLFTFDRQTGKEIAKVSIKSKNVQPGTHFVPGTDTVILSGNDRIIHQNPTSDKERLDLIVPGQIDLLTGEGTWIYFLYRYIHEPDKKEMSVLMGHDVKNAQLYGRAAVQGAATGRFALSGDKIIAELAPGNIHVLGKSELKDFGAIQTGSALADIATDGSDAAFATADGKLIGIDVSTLK